MIGVDRHRSLGASGDRRPQRRVLARVAWATLAVGFGIAAVLLALTLIGRSETVSATPVEGFSVEPVTPATTIAPTSDTSPAVSPSPAQTDTTSATVPPAASDPVPPASASAAAEPASVEPSIALTIPVAPGILVPAGAPPVRLRIPALGVDAPIDAVGNDGDAMEVPATADRVGWYEFGPRPGDEGSAVLAAHVDWGGRRGVFFDLDEIPPGAVVEVEFSDGGIRRFEVIRLTSYDKVDLPTAEIFRRTGQPVVTLVTCGGAFNPSLDRYEDNVVAYAVEIVDQRR